MGVIADLIIKLGVQDSGVGRTLDGAGRSASKFGSHLLTVGKYAAVAGGAAGLAGLVYTLKDGYSEWEDSTKVAAQTGAVIKSTGGIAHVTAGHVDKLAQSILAKSGENMLLTFTGIRNEVGKGNDVFDRATHAVVDMDTAMTHGNSTAESLSKTSILVGKALNDPIKGATALRRVGVSLTSAQQDQIKAFVKSGDTMKAQKLILGELNKEFGGSAEAMGKTLPGQIKILRENFNNMAGDLFTKLVPALTSVLTWVDGHWPQISATFAAVFDAAGFAITKVIVPTLAFLIAEGRKVVAWFQANWPQISATAIRVFDAIAPPAISTFNTLKAIILGAVTVIEAFWSRFGSTIIAVARNDWNIISGVIKGVLNIIRGVVNVIGGLIHGDWSRVWEGIKQIFGGVWTAMEAILRGALGNMKAMVGAALGVVASIIRGSVGAVASAARSVGAALIEGIVSGLSSLGGRIVAMIKAAVNGVISRINSALTFHVSINTHVPGVGKVGFGYTSNIPYLATGVRNFGGGLAIVGERGPELVNLPRGADVFSNSQSQRMAGGGGVTVQGDLVIREELDIDRAAARLTRRLAVAG